MKTLGMVKEFVIVIVATAVAAAAYGPTGIWAAFL